MADITEKKFKEDVRRLSLVEDAFENMPNDATEIELIEMIANAMGEPFEVVHKRFLDIKSKKKNKK